jgi:hypothetical protein
MPSGFDPAWCRVSPASATPNEAVPLPAWAGWVTRPGSNSRSAARSAPRAGKSALSPDGDIITIPVSVLALNYQVPPDFLACAKPGKGPCAGTGISGKSGFFIHHRKRHRTRFTRHP